MFNFLNLFLKLFDYYILNNNILKEIIAKIDNIIEIVFKENSVDITLTFNE